MWDRLGPSARRLGGSDIATCLTDNLQCVQPCPLQAALVSSSADTSCSAEGRVARVSVVGSGPSEHRWNPQHLTDATFLLETSLQNNTEPPVGSTAGDDGRGKQSSAKAKVRLNEAREGVLLRTGSSVCAGCYRVCVQCMCACPVLVPEHLSASIPARHPEQAWGSVGNRPLRFSFLL